MAKNPAKDVTEAELAVLRGLWERSPGTIRELTERLYPGGSTSHYATVQKLLERLEDKGFVTRDASGSPHRFVAAVGQGELIGRRLREMAEKLAGGSVVPLVTQLVKGRALSKSEIGELRELIDELDRRPAKGKKG